MSEFNLLEESSWQPFASLGLTHPFFSFSITTILHTWIILLIIIVALVVISYFLRKPGSFGHFLVLSGVHYFMKLCEQSLGMYSFNHVSFVTSLFIFIFLCNSIAVIPWLEEPTKDLNTTLALGIIAFSYTQMYAIYLHGIIGYIKEYFSPFFIMLPLNIIGRLSTVVSISFRLFGNIFGGAIISHIYFGSISGSFILEVLGLITGLNLLITLFFGIFEGFLQAFVFTMLTLTYLSIAIYGESGNAEEIA